jgi:hypothetical protein
MKRFASAAPVLALCLATLANRFTSASTTTPSPSETAFDAAVSGSDAGMVSKNPGTDSAALWKKLDGVVESIELTSNQLVVRGDDGRTVPVTVGDSIAIRKNGKSAHFGDLQVGDRVSLVNKADVPKR